MLRGLDMAMEWHRYSNSYLAVLYDRVQLGFDYVIGHKQKPRETLSICVVGQYLINHTLTLSFGD